MSAAQVRPDPATSVSRTLDVVVPVYNEAAVLPALFARLDEALAPSRLLPLGVVSCRVVFVDDGSRDDTAAIIAAEIRAGRCATLLRLARNFGHQAAVDAGLKHTRADFVAVMDADLQDPPEVIARMVERASAGFDVVHAQRVGRKEGPFKVACYWAFYRLLSVLSDTAVAIDSGDFCLMSRRVVDAICALPEKLRFARGLRSWVGFRQTTMSYERDRRSAGESKYPLAKLYELATDGIASSSVRPLKIAQLFTFVLAILLVILTAAVTVRLITSGHDDAIENRFLWGYLLASLIGFMLMSTLYVLCAYVRRMYLEVKGRPTWVLMETVEGADAAPCAPDEARP